MSLIARFMGPAWGRQDPGGPHVGPMNFAIWGGMISDTNVCSANRSPWPDDLKIYHMMRIHLRSSPNITKPSLIMYLFENQYEVIKWKQFLGYCPFVRGTTGGSQ